MTHPQKAASSAFLSQEVLALQPEGKVLIGFNFASVNGQARRKAVWLNASVTFALSGTVRGGGGVPIANVSVIK